MLEVPEGCPTTLFEAFAYVAACERPSLDTLRVMVMAEAAGKALYEDMALGTGNSEVQELLRHNGREELAHAHRVAKAIHVLTGEVYPVPEPDENPYLVDPIPRSPISREALLKLAEGEFGGDYLYSKWADAIGNEEAAALFRQNGREETEHGARLQQAADLLVD